MAVVWIMLLMSLALWLTSCAYKHIETHSIDTFGNPVTLQADVIYLFTDQKTSGFTATSPGLNVKFGLQESQAKAEFLTELLKAYTSIP